MQSPTIQKDSINLDDLAFKKQNFQSSEHFDNLNTNIDKYFQKDFVKPIQEADNNSLDVIMCNETNLTDFKSIDNYENQSAKFQAQSLKPYLSKNFDTPAKTQDASSSKFLDSTADSFNNQFSLTEAISAQTRNSYKMIEKKFDFDSGNFQGSQGLQNGIKEPEFFHSSFDKKFKTSLSGIQCNLLGQFSSSDDTFTFQNDTCSFKNFQGKNEESSKQQKQDEVKDKKFYFEKGKIDELLSCFETKMKNSASQKLAEASIFRNSQSTIDSPKYKVSENFSSVWDKDCLVNQFREEKEDFVNNSKIFYKSDSRSSSISSHKSQKSDYLLLEKQFEEEEEYQDIKKYQSHFQSSFKNDNSDQYLQQKCIFTDDFIKKSNDQKSKYKFQEKDQSVQHSNLLHPNFQTKKNSIISDEGKSKNAGDLLVRIFSDEKNYVGLPKDQILELNKLFKNILKLSQEDQLSLTILAKSLFGDKIHNVQPSKTSSFQGLDQKTQILYKKNDYSRSHPSASTDVKNCLLRSNNLNKHRVGTCHQSDHQDSYQEKKQVFQDQSDVINISSTKQDHFWDRSSQNEDSGEYSEPLILNLDWEAKNQYRVINRKFTCQQTIGYDSNRDEPIICGKVFKERVNLQNHIRVHTGEKPFICRHEGCGRRFRAIGNRSDHERRHYKEKPYECKAEEGKCCMCFYRKYQLRNHIAKKHRHLRLSTQELERYCNKTKQSKI